MRSMPLAARPIQRACKPWRILQAAIASLWHALHRGRLITVADAPRRKQRTLREADRRLDWPSPCWQCWQRLWMVGRRRKVAQQQVLWVLIREHRLTSLSSSAHMQPGAF